MYIVQFLNPNGTIDFVTDMILSANSSIAVSEVGSAMVVFPSLPATVINKISSQPDYLVELYWKAYPSNNYTLIFGGFVTDLRITENAEGTQYAVRAESYEALLRRRVIAYPRSYTPDGITYFQNSTVSYIIGRTVEYNLGINASNSNRYRSGLFTFPVSYSTTSGGPILAEYRCEEKEVYQVCREVTANDNGWFRVTRTSTGFDVSYTYNFSVPATVDILTINNPNIAELTKKIKPPINGQTIAKYRGSNETAFITLSGGSWFINGYEQLISVPTVSLTEAQWAATLAELRNRTYQEVYSFKTSLPKSSWLSLGAAFRVADNLDEVRCVRSISFSAGQDGKEQFSFELGRIV